MSGNARDRRRARRARTTWAVLDIDGRPIDPLIERWRELAATMSDEQLLAAIARLAREVLG